MRAAQSGQVGVHLCPRPAWLVGGQRLAIVLVHGVEILVERERSLHHRLAVGVVGAQQHGRFIGAPECLQTVFHPGYHRAGHPFHIVFVGVHRLSQAHKQAHVGIFLDEGGNALAGVIADERRDGAVAVLRLQPVVVGKGFGEDDIVEHLDNEDAAPVSLVGEEGEHLLVFPECLLVHLKGEGIVFQPHERGEGMPVPQVEGVHLVVYQHVEIVEPLPLIVKPREVFGRVGIFIHLMAGPVERLLQTDAGPTQHHLRILPAVSDVEIAMVPGIVGQFAATIDHPRPIVAVHDDVTFLAADVEALFLHS